MLINLGEKIRAEFYKHILPALQRCCAEKAVSFSPNFWSTLLLNVED
jgi:hypothetical protein